MQREELSPDIEIKYDQLLAHMAEKNNIVDQFLRILRQICDAEIFYSRSLDKFANNISKLIVGKDPLKDVFIIFERAISAKSQQSLQLANNIKDDMIPFLQKYVIDHVLQEQLKNKQPAVKNIRGQVQHKLRKLRFAQGNYRRICDQFKKMGPAESRAEMEEKDKIHKRVTELEGNLTQAINSYNHTIEEYLLAYTGICEQLSDIETKRKGQVRDGINKFMIFEISCIKNIEYNIPRYMSSLEKMNERLLIQDKIVTNQPNSSALNLAKISVPNYLNSIQDKQFQVPSSHKAILELKKNTPNMLNSIQFHKLVAQLHPLLSNAARNHNVRVLKEIVYFSLNIRTLLGTKGRQNAQPIQQDGGPSSTGSLPDEGPRLLLLDAVLCHPIFEDSAFWTKYEEKLFDIINKEKRSISIGSQSKDVQISLSFLAGDIQFLKLVNYHPLPASILAKFSEGSEEFKIPTKVQSASPELEDYLARNKNLLQ